MRHSSFIPLALMVLLVLSSILSPAAPASRADHVDIVPLFTFPEEGGIYQSEHGMIFNVTIMNKGNADANLTGSVQLEIRNEQNGEVVFRPLSRPIKDIKANGSMYLAYPNWTSARGGKFQAKATATYFGDSNGTNNIALVNFTMFSENWNEDPKLESATVLPVFGDTSELFTYRVRYTYNKLPDSILVEIDGTNHSMWQEDPQDIIAEDGKYYIFSTYLGMGNHHYRCFGRYMDMNFSTPENGTLFGPWVNITLNTPDVMPPDGYVTTEFQVSVYFGSSSNLPPDDIYATVRSARYDLERSSLTPVYTTGRVQFKVAVPGTQMLPSPVPISFHCRLGEDVLDIGPFQFNGSSSLRGNVSGQVRDQDGSPLPGATVTLVPGASVAADEDGRYRIGTYEGRGFTLICSAEGYLDKTVQNIDVHADEERTLDIEMRPIPVGGTVQGRVTSMIEGARVPIPGIVLVLDGYQYLNSTVTDQMGEYVFADIPGGEGYTLSIDDHPYVPLSVTFNIQENEFQVRNFTLQELPMEVAVDPGPGEVPVETIFTLTFPDIVNISTLDIAMAPPLALSTFLSEGMTSVRIVPAEQMTYATNYTLVLNPGLQSVSGAPLVWRVLRWEYRTSLQPEGDVIADPPPDMIDMPLSYSVQLWFTIGIDHDTVDVRMHPSADPADEVGLNISFSDMTNRSDHSSTSTVLEISFTSLEHGTSYVIVVNDTLLDLYGRRVLSSPFIYEFTTVKEPDRDSDGVVDGEDAFPDDPAASIDGDKDGHPDTWNSGMDQDDSTTGLTLDAFPSDASEHTDSDGDGIGDGADTDDDNDGMEDSWELRYDLDPLDPNDAFEDPDEDGADNLEEFKAGTDPTDKGSVPEKDEPNYWLWIGLAVLAVFIVIAIGLIARVRKDGPAQKEE